ncbi:MAG: MoaD/ThiS family protein [Myxococcota bacterium]
MGLGDALRGIFSSGPKISVRIFVNGRIGEGWRKVDETYRLKEGTTLAELIARADRDGLDLSGAIEASPHLRHTIMLNGERCRLDENRDRVLEHGDEVFLLAPIAGG